MNDKLNLEHETPHFGKPLLCAGAGLKQYSIVYADPPWEVMAGSKQGRKKGDSQKSLPLTYPTMSLDEIKGLPIKQLADKNAVLFLWTINKYLEQSYEVARQWGFAPSTMLVWDKTPKGIGLGGTFTLSNEYLLFCRRGTLTAKQRVKGNHWHLPREKHSRKPDFFRNLITDTFGDLPRVELFARENFQGWDAFGNQCNESIDLDQYRSTCT
jgi:N6-adenosine-specific RNA methylase IME4